MVVSHRPRHNSERGRHAKPYCQCWNKRGTMPWKQLNACACGEDNEVSEWKWQQPELNSTMAILSDDQKQVTFHPFYSSGTAAIKGDTPLLQNHHYYWEVKMLTETYGTDIMVGIGTNKVNMTDSLFKFTSLLGQDAESYGLSYTGAVQHNAALERASSGFCRGTIVGVRVDMWKGTLEFYINRKPQGVSFCDLRRHQTLFPMVCATAAQSTMRLIYAASWRASLLVDAAKTLAASVSHQQRPKLPPGLWHQLRKQFWLTLPTEGCIADSEDKPDMQEEPAAATSSVPLSSGMKRRRWQASAHDDPSADVTHPICVPAHLY